MPVIAAAICPHPPLLVTEFGAGVTAEMLRLRQACRDAVRRLVHAGASHLIMIGAGRTTEQSNLPTHVEFSPWGLPVDVPVPGGSRDYPPGMAGPGEPGAPPLSLRVGAWLLADTPRPAEPLTHTMVSVAADTPPAECVRLGEQLASAGPVALLAMGDGSACRGEKSPGYDDPRAQPFDGMAAAALAHGDLSLLLALDAGLATELQATGRAPWQVMAGAVAASGGEWRAVLTYAEAPYGVGYVVANWERE